MLTLLTSQKKTRLKPIKKIDYTFDSADTVLPSDVIKETAKLNEGEKSAVITVMDSRTYQKKYYVVHLVKKAEKKSRLERIQITTKRNHYE